MEGTTSIRQLPGQNSSQNGNPVQNNVRLVTQEKRMNTQYSPVIPMDTPPTNNYNANQSFGNQQQNISYNPNPSYNSNPSYNTNNNVSSSQDKSPASMIPQNSPNADIHEILSQIERASAKNLTTLPPRDIPIDTSRVVSDERIKPDYIPTIKKETMDKYLKEMKDEEEKMKNNALKNEKEEKWELLFNDFQEPLIIMILFFLFQLPFSTKLFRRFFPFLITKDGYPRMTGYLVKSCLFGGSFFVIHKLIQNMGNLNSFDLF